jgi:hypothetical protein
MDDPIRPLPATGAAFHAPRNSSGSFAIFAAIRRASCPEGWNKSQRQYVYLLDERAAFSLTLVTVEDQSQSNNFDWGPGATTKRGN